MESSSNKANNNKKCCELCINRKYDINHIAVDHINNGINEIKVNRLKKQNVIWLETSGCFGEIISLLNAEEPDVLYLLTELINLIFCGTLDGDEGTADYEKILDISREEFILIVSGAIPVKSDGLYTIMATYNGKKITAKYLVDLLAPKAKYIISVGSCACYGGPSAARPNLSEAKGVGDFLKREDIIKIPGCPANPIWTMGIIGYIVSYGKPDLDDDGRPKAYYGELIHDRCERRKYFDAGIFAKKLGDKECMFMIGCKGPSTYAYCPVSHWNGTENWPIGDNTNCIGCAGPGFPDSDEPFVKYGGI